MSTRERKPKLGLCPSRECFFAPLFSTIRVSLLDALAPSTSYRISSIRVRQESPTSVILAFCATVYPDGSIYTVKSQEAKFATAKKRSDIRVYDSAFVRRWDEWMPLDGEIKQVHFVRLNRDKEGQYSFETEKQKDEAGAETSRPKVVSPLAGTKLVRLAPPFPGLSVWNADSWFVTCSGMSRLLYLVDAPRLPRKRSRAEPGVPLSYRRLPRTSRNWSTQKDLTRYSRSKRLSYPERRRNETRLARDETRQERSRSKPNHGSLDRVW